MSNFHIGFVETGYPHPHGGGGAGTYVQLVSRELVRRGHHVSVVASFCSQCSLLTQDQGVNVYRPNLKSNVHWYLSKIPGLQVGSLAVRYLEHGYRLYRFLERLNASEKIDLVEFTEGGDFWHAFKPTFPYLVHLHGSRYTSLRLSNNPVGRSDWYQRRLELFFIQRAKWLVSPSQALLDLVLGEMNTRPERTAVIPYPVDPNFAGAFDQNSRKKRGLKVVLFAARNDPIKGADVLFNAIPYVLREVPGVEFRIYGQNNPDLAYLENVHMSEFVPREELLCQYRQADICVIPSLWDNSPNTVYEAMVSKKAVVATRVGGIPELVIDGQTGLLVEPNDPTGLAKAITNLLRDDVRRRLMGENGYQRIQILASLTKNVEERLTLFQSIISDHRIHN